MNTTIYTTQHKSNYTIISNELIVNPLPAVAYRVLTYLLSRPKNWRKNNIDIQKKLNLSAYAVKKALRQIKEYGYAIVKRFKDGHTMWHFFDTPKRDLPSVTPVFKPQVEIPPVENQPVLINKETIINYKIIRKVEHFSNICFCSTLCCQTLSLYRSLIHLISKTLLSV